ncbi:MAG: hypothetical protein ACHQIH_01255 [Ignavibacteria bacterium]
MPQKFIGALIYDKENITDYINIDELASSARLGISYDGVKNKILIGTDIPEEIKTGIKSGKYQYSLKEELLTDGFISVALSIQAANYEKLFYFNEGFVNSTAYHTRMWGKKESKYFKFRISDPKYFNDYCIKRLDDFVDMIADTLGYSIQEKEFLEKEKILYTFCKDESEVKMITGYGARGMALLGNDEVVTSYQTHFHEVAHILINFKLRKLGLYTLPFFMEGFAVAVGGRGGMAPRVVTDLGYYLQKTGLLTYDSILTDEQFRSNDGSMSYPVSGLYNSFLLSELGGEKYLELYRKVNGDLEYMKGIKPLQIILPENGKFEKFMPDYQNDKVMYVNAEDTIEPALYIRGSRGNIALLEGYYKFFVSNKFFIGPSVMSDFPDYRSRMQSSINNDSGLCKSKYCVTSDSNSIKIYNLFNDEIVYSRENSLSDSIINIPVFMDYGERYFTFFIRKDILNNDFDDGYRIEDNR